MRAMFLELVAFVLAHTESSGTAGLIGVFFGGGLVLVVSTLRHIRRRKRPSPWFLSLGLGIPILLALAVLSSTLARSETILADAIERGDVARVTALLDSGSDPDASTSDGVTPLFHAVASGNVEIVKLLLSRGANPNHQDVEGTTPLHAAVLAGLPEAERLLIAAGGDTHARNRWGLTPHDMGPRKWQEAVQSEFPVSVIDGIMTDLNPEWAKGAIIFVTEDGDQEDLRPSRDQLFRVEVDETIFRMVFWGRQPAYVPQSGSPRPERLTNSQRQLQAYRVSPDGESIAVRWKEPGQAGASVLSVLRLGEHVTQEDVYTIRGEHSCTDATCRLTWSSDGRYIYYWDGSVVRRIALDRNTVEKAPRPRQMPFAFEEKGTVFTDKAGEHFSLRSADGDRTLTFGKGLPIIWMAPVAFSPNLRYVAFSIDGPALVFEDLTIDAVHDTLGASYSPAFSRDGQLLAFYEESKGAVVVINVKRWPSRRPLPPLQRALAPITSAPTEN